MNYNNSNSKQFDTIANKSFINSFYIGNISGSNSGSKHLATSSYNYMPKIGDGKEKKGTQASSSFISGLSKISSSFASMKCHVNYYISNPLVIMLGIGDYDSDVMPPLLGVKKDYLNMIYLFYYLFGYSFVFQNKITNNIECLNYNHNSKNKIKVSLNECERKVKTYWEDDEIDVFFEKCKDMVVDNKHDSCIFILSCHGDNESVILDSKGNEIGLGNLFGRFNGKYCQYLIDKPKLIFSDACRGSLRSKPTKPLKISHVQDKKVQKTNDNGGHGALKQFKLKVAGSAKYAHNKNISMLNDLITINEEKQEIKEIEIVDEEFELKNSDDINTSILIKVNDNYYHEEANFCYIFANPDGYAVPDGGSKGGYLIRALKRVLSNEKISSQKNLSSIILSIREETQALAGTASMVCVEDVNTMIYNVFFQKRKASSS